MAKQNRFGQASVFTLEQMNKLRKVVDDDLWRTFFEVCWYTGERCGAVRQLRVADVYDEAGRVRDVITFRSDTRKHDRFGRADTRQVPTHPTLKLVLGFYRPTHPVWLFPGQDWERPISFSATDKALRRYLAIAGLSRGGFSLHSFRRTFITQLSEQGTDLKVIQQITGHRDIKSLAGYVEVSPARVQRAVSAIA